jgi:hypothetical protein
MDYDPCHCLLKAIIAAGPVISKTKNQYFYDGKANFFARLEKMSGPPRKFPANPIRVPAQIQNGGNLRFRFRFAAINSKWKSLGGHSAGKSDL